MTRNDQKPTTRYLTIMLFLGIASGVSFGVALQVMNPELLFPVLMIAVTVVGIRSIVLFTDLFGLKEASALADCTSA